MNHRDDATTCPSWEVLLQWSEAEVEGDDSELVAHLKACERCQERLGFSDFVARALGQRIDQ